MKRTRYIRLLLLLYVLLVSFACKKDPFDANSGTFTDQRDNHSYKWVKIGDQIWMAENLAYLPYLCAPDAQCGIYIYDYQRTGSASVNYLTYGCLYNWETAMKVCPEGWHLPSDEEWMKLELFLGMKFEDLDQTDYRGDEANIGGKLKETGTLHWLEPNNGATNETGFSALPAGGLNDRYMGINRSTGFWTSTDDKKNNTATSRGFFNEYKGRFRFISKKAEAISVRCIKD